MALTVRAKTLWLLAVGAATIILILVPLRFTPVVPQSIDALSIQARLQLIQKYEPVGQQMRARVDTLRQQIRLRFGGTRPSQDSLLEELARHADRILSITSHLRDPRRATYEEKRNDIAAMLDGLTAQGEGIRRQLLDYLK